MYLQQDGFLDKLVRVADLDKSQRPNQNGLGTEFYVRLYKQADVLQCFFFEDLFREEL
jgi:hypothetical protein